MFMLKVIFLSLFGDEKKKVWQFFLRLKSMKIAYIQIGSHFFKIGLLSISP